jgi:flavin reductase (DIM6/NTAB) family NADH-FMN oxidoreductase RutF
MTGPASAPAVNPAVLRDVLGHFASGVVVVTARAGAALHGFTCQSFASLSLEPPLVSFAPARTSSTWPRIREVGAFCVNVLAADHRELSAGFARPGGTVDKFAGVEWCPAPSGAPVLEGVSAWVDCTLWAEYDGGDHTIAVGHVHDLGADPARLPLLFYRGGYGIEQR